MSAADEWARSLAAWAIPNEILDQAPESPWGFPPAIFGHAAEHAITHARAASMSTRRALEALDPPGTVLDVGVGGGAGCLPLAPPATFLCGVDESEDMLATFSGLAAGRGVDHTTVAGRWPEVADRVDAADVVVCHHVFYNVADLVPFVDALSTKARRRVVVELTATHPQSALNDLWLRFWDVQRPTGPDCELAAAVVSEAGYQVHVDRWEAPAKWSGAPREEVVAFVRRRLCLGADRDPEVATALDAHFELAPRRLATLWWDTA
jgi:SAM-dependent methyltransferase